MADHKINSRDTHPRFRFQTTTRELGRVGVIQYGGRTELPQFLQRISFKVPWGEIAAKAWGPEDGKPFLGLHGWLDNANTFDTLAPLLPENIRFIAIDFPGHGKSSHRWPGIVVTKRRNDLK